MFISNDIHIIFSLRPFLQWNNYVTMKLKKKTLGLKHSTECCLKMYKNAMAVDRRCGPTAILRL